MPQPTNPLSFWSVVLPIKKLSDETFCQIKKKGHLWKMIIKILHFYILLTMLRESALINILTRLIYTDYTQQLF